MEVSHANGMTVIRAPFHPSYERFSRRIRLTDVPDLAEVAQELFTAASHMLVPVSIHSTAYIQEHRSMHNLHRVTIADQVFTGKALVALDDVHRVFPYIASCGNQMETFDCGSLDMIASYWLEELKLQALMQARETLVAYVKETYLLHQVRSLNPGSGNTDIWPVEENRGIFSLLESGNPAGVRLTESSLMIPTKSVSGLLFSSEKDYESCAYCERENCPDRRVPFMQKL